MVLTLSIGATDFLKKHTPKKAHEAMNAVCKKYADYFSDLEAGFQFRRRNESFLDHLHRRLLHFLPERMSPEPEKASGITTNEMVLGDRFLSSSFSGHVSIDGHLALLKGQGMIGYDKAKKSFTSVWTDTLSAGMMIGNGAYNDKEKIITESGSFTNPVTGLQEKFRSETKFIDSDNYKRTVFAVNKAGKEAKLMEFEYTRKN